MFSTIKSSSGVIARGLRVAVKDPAIVVYPLLLFLVLLISIPSLNLLIIWLVAKFLSIPVLEDNLTVSASLVYALAIFTSLMIVSALLLVMACVVSAATKAELTGSKAPLIDGRKYLDGRMIHIVKIGLLCFPLTLIPLAIYAQRKNLTKHPFSIITSSLTLGVSGLAPAILSTNDGVRDTIINTVNTLGKNWKEGILVKVYLYGFVIALTFFSFLPALIERYWFDDTTAGTVGWLSTALLFLLIISALKIFGTIFNTLLFQDAKNKK